MKTTEAGGILSIGGPLKVWSLVVTVMGDHVQAGNSDISGTRLREILGTLGIRSEAIRTALHRLRRDGWITTRREGRVSRHALSDSALNATRAAAPLVYSAAPPPRPRLWLIVTAPDAEIPVEGLAIAPRAWITDNVPRDALGAPLSAPLPESIAARLIPSERVTDIAAIARHADQRFDPVRRLALLHAWRRLVVRLPPLLEPLLPDGHDLRVIRRRIAPIPGALGGCSRTPVAEHADTAPGSGSRFIRTP